MMKILYSLILFSQIIAQQSSDWAEKTLRSLSEEEKIAQLFMIGITPAEESAALSLIKTYKVGGVLLVGSIFLGQTIQKQITLVNTLQNASDLPLLIGQDCEWGLTMRLVDGIKFPRNLTLGALADYAILHTLGYTIGQQCKDVGVHINFAPVVDINSNPKNPVIGSRSFGEVKERVAQASCFFMKGLQDSGIYACAKHFPGHGDTAVDSHYALPCITHTQEHLENFELYPFSKVIEQGIKCIMNAHLFLPNLDKDMPSSLSKYIVTTLLKEKYKFEGLIITDALNMRAITNQFNDEPGKAELKALLAGNDIILYPNDVPAAIKLIQRALRDQKITQEELDKKALKILKAKEEFNLHNQRLIKEKDSLEQREKALALKKLLYRNAVTLVKNENNTLPFQESLEVAFFLIQPPQSCALEKALPVANLFKLTSSDLKSKNILSIRQNTIVLAIFDVINNASKNYNISSHILKFIDGLKRARKKVIVLIFGTPYALNLFNDEDALLVAYEDDEDAQRSAVEVLYGKHNPCGALPISTPNFAAGISLKYS